MATHHAQSNEVVDLKTWAKDVPAGKTKVIIKTKQMELARLAMLPDQEFREHRVAGPITVHCVRGEIDFSAKGVVQRLRADQMVYLEPGEPHALKARMDSVVLLTIVFID